METYTYAISVSIMWNAARHQEKKIIQFKRSIENNGLNPNNSVYTCTRILAECKTQNKKDEIVGSAYTRITITIKITICILI